MSMAQVFMRASTEAAKFMPLQKRAYVRSKGLMRAYRLIPCQHCGRDDGAVCGAHSNWAVHGKGKGIKADDNRCASLCHACHSALDQGRWMTEAERKAMWWDAHVRTVQALVDAGLWPQSVPVPGLSINPFA